MSPNFPFISDEQVKKFLPMSEAIVLMEKAFTQITNNSVVIPQRINLDMSEVNANTLVMPVYSSVDKKYGVKIVSLNQNNSSNNLPLIHALMIFFNAANGKPLALLDAENLTAIRTGAASGLATKLFSNPNATNAAIFGAGVQAKYQLRAICDVRTIKKVFLFDKNETKAKFFKKELEIEIDIEILITNDKNNLKDAEIICTATASAIPVFDDKYLAEGTHINAIGSYQPTKREITSETVQRATLFVDSRKATLKEAGELIIPLYERIDLCVTEIGEVLLDKDQGRKSREEITLFKSVGNAAQDLICAIHIFDKINK